MAFIVAIGLQSAQRDGDDAEIQRICLRWGLTVGTHRARCHTLRYLLMTYAARYILCHETNLLVTGCVCVCVCVCVSVVMDLKWQFSTWFA